MNHEEGFEDEARFHEALGYLCKRYKKVSSGDLKHIIGIINPSMAERFFERKECQRLLRNIAQNNGFTNGKIYESLTFNGATYEVVDDTGSIICIGASYFEWIDVGEI